MTTENPLAGIRARIDTIDDQLVALMARRYAILAEVVEIKAAHGIAHNVPSRVEEVIQRNIRRGAELGVPEQQIREVYQAIIDSAHRFEAGHLLK